METQSIVNKEVAICLKATDELIRWCEKEMYMEGGRCADITRRVSDGQHRPVARSFKQWEYRYSTLLECGYLYRIIRIEELMDWWYAASLEIGIKRRNAPFDPVIVRIFDYITGVERAKTLLGYEEGLRTMARAILR